MAIQDETILVAVAGARDVVSTGLRAILARERGIDALDILPRSGVTPDVVLYDALGMEADRGAEFSRLVEEDVCPVVFLVRDFRPDLRKSARARGAFGYISLEADVDDILATIRIAAETWTPREGAWSQTPAAFGALESLTPREIDVLTGVARGFSNVEICDDLGLGLNTVKTHLRTAYRKIGVVRRSQAMAWCLRHGFEPPPGRPCGRRVRAARRRLERAHDRDTTDV